MTQIDQVIKTIGVPDEESGDLDVLSPFGIITAYRSRFSADENAERSRELAEVLEGAGLTVHPIQGTWQVVDESSEKGSVVPVKDEAFFVTADVFEDLLGRLKEAAEQFEQVSFIVSDGHSVWIQTGEEKQPLGDHIKVDDLETAYKTVRNQSAPFSFAEYVAARLDAAAELVVAGAQRTTVMSGIVLASGLARLLDMLRRPDEQVKHVPHNVGLTDDGFATQEEEDSTKPQQLRVDRVKPFAIISGFRTYKKKKLETDPDIPRTHDDNLRRSKLVLQYINRLFKKPGAYKLFGYWAEQPANTKHLTYKEASEQGLIGEPMPEESYLFLKPDWIEQDKFEDMVHQIGNWFDQDSVMVGDGENVYLIERSGAKYKVGTGLTAPLVAKAYSRMRNKPNVPFVFAGTQQPTSGGGAQVFSAAGLKYFAGAETYGTSYQSAILRK